MSTNKTNQGETSPGEPCPPFRPVHIDYEISPDWTQTWRASDAERELHDFKFKGPGWYITETYVVLVVPTGGILPKVDSQWAGPEQWDSDQLFKFYVYNGRNPCEAFNQLVNAPVRVDIRGK